MNAIILEEINATNAGRETESVFNVDDVRELNNYIRANYLDRWTELHGDDEKNREETGYHLLQNDGATSYHHGVNQAATVADGFYHLRFEVQGDRVVNEDGDPNATLRQLAEWLMQFYEDLSTTNTGLGRMTDMVMADKGLSRKIPDAKIAADAGYSNDMAEIIAKAIRETEVGLDNKLDADDIREINAYIRKHYEDTWVRLHGDDEKGEETGFHLVQNDGATTRMFGKNFVNTVLDGINHLCFEIKGDTLLNEDGDPNAKISDVADWFNYFYFDQSDAGIGLDYLVDAVKSDEGLSRNTSAKDINAGAEYANQMNHIIVEAIEKTQVVTNQDAGHERRRRKANQRIHPRELPREVGGTARR